MYNNLWVSSGLSLSWLSGNTDYSLSFCLSSFLFFECLHLSFRSLPIRVLDFCNSHGSVGINSNVLSSGHEQRCPTPRPTLCYKISATTPWHFRAAPNAQARPTGKQSKSSRDRAARGEPDIYPPATSHHSFALFTNDGACVTAPLATSNPNGRRSTPPRQPTVSLQIPAAGTALGRGRGENPTAEAVRP